LLLLLLTWAPPSWAALPRGNAITDPSALLRNALPVDPGDLQDLQHRLEATSVDLRAKRWSALGQVAQRSQSLLGSKRAAILDRFEPDQRAHVEELLDGVSNQLQKLAEAASSQDRDAYLEARRLALGAIGSAEDMLVKDFPFAIPSEYDALPRLLGRATVRLSTTKGDLITVVDGFNAPLTAGAFVDLVQRGFYEAEPYYNQTFEELGLFKAEPVLPFNAKGTLGWAHSDQDLADGSSQFFLFLSEPELTPAGLNLIDGRYAAFGYVVDGFDVLDNLTAEDGIVSAKVLEGAQNLHEHA